MNCHRFLNDDLIPLITRLQFPQMILHLSVQEDPKKTQEARIVLHKHNFD